MSRTDEEQTAQLIKSWWRQYGNYILLGALFFLISSFGIRYWKKYTIYKTEQASTTYMNMLVAFDQNKNDEMELYAERLTDNPSSPYAIFASFILAKAAVNDNNLEKAKKNLQFVIKNTSDDLLKQIAQIRLARILIALNQPKQALDLLAMIKKDDAYMTKINEIKGDALLALRKPEEAKQMYQQAQKTEDANISEKPSTINESPLLKIKMRQF